MRRAVTDWCGRHIVAAYVLITFTMVAIVFGALFVFFPPHSEASGAAKPVETPAPTVSCATGYSSDYKYGATECKVKLKDGRTVTCVSIDKGTSCDWAQLQPRKASDMGGRGDTKPQRRDRVMRIETTTLISLWFLGLLSIPFVMCWIIFDVFPYALGVPHEEAIVKATKTTKTIPCKTLDDKSGIKECKVKLDDGRTVTCVVDSRVRSCDWRHAK